MKRKLFSAILFGALLTASTSGLTSCKDYDDDISNLQSQIDKLATADQLSAKVSEMQAAISAAQSAAESKAAAAQSVADAAKSAAADAAAAASKAQSTADGATQAAKDAAAAAAAADEVAKAAKAAVDKLAAEGHATKAELEEAAKAAQAYVDSVKKAIEETHAADKAAIEKAINDGLDAVKAEIAKTNEELAALAKRLDACEEKLAAIEAGEGQEEALKAIQEEVEAVADALEAIIGEYTSMVTAVDLYVGGGDLYNAIWNNELRFVYVDQEKDTKFPAAEGVADEQITFSSANKNVMTTDKLVVRVSPTNAVLNAANISLLNSQGADLSDYVEVKAVKPFEELILGSTRAAEGNGLWEVEFKVKDGVDAAKFADAVTVKKGLTTYGIKYAVAVQNTESEETRRVISAYDVEVLPEDYEPATNEIEVTNRDGNWTSISAIRNRYEYVPNKKLGNIVADNGVREDGKASELAWKNEPGVAGGSEPTVQDQGDNRWNKNFIDVEVGKSIDIFVGGVVNPVNETSDLVKGFYVTLDSDNAIESSPSEINAWESYSYTNVGVPGDSKRPAKMFYGNEGSISIDSPAALGDKIGFRVYVVNLDGTLVDPDGRAFYVNVATEKVVAKLTAEEMVAELHPVKNAAGLYDYHFGGANLYAEATLTAEAKKALASGTVDEWTITSNASAYGNNVVDVYDNKVVLNSNGSTTYNDFDVVPDLAKGTVKVIINTPYKFLDNGTYTAQTTVRKANGTEICDLSVSFKKVLPEYAPALAWNSLYNPTEQIFANVASTTNANIYKKHEGTDPQAIELNKAMEFLNYGSGLTDNSWYTLSFANSGLYKGKPTAAVKVPKETKAPSVTGPENVNDVKNNVPVRCTAAAVSDYEFAPTASAVDGKAHEIAYEYNYGWLSLTFNKQTAAYTMSEWVKPAAKTLAMTFASWIDYEQIAWNGAQPSVTYSPGHDGQEAARISLLGSVGGTTQKEVAQGVFVVITSSSKYYTKFNGNYVQCNSDGEICKAADGTVFTDQSKENILANISLTQPMPSGTTYAKYDAEKGIVVTYIVGTDHIYKKVSNGDWYAVNYDAAAKAWKFVKKTSATDNTPTTTILDNQTETNVIANGSKAGDGAIKYEVIMVQDVTSPATASKLIAWNTLIRNIQNGKSMFGESAAKAVDFMSLKTNDYIYDVEVEADGASPFTVELENDSDLVFTNKTGTLNPSTSGTLKISAKDCFGNVHSWTLPYTIVK